MPFCGWLNSGVSVFNVYKNGAEVLKLRGGTDMAIRLLLLIVVLMSCSCGSFSSPHENFKAHMSSAVNKKISDEGTWARDDRFVSVRDIDNGNKEYKYILRQGCFCFFEVGKDAETIVGWRFEGDVKDCEIAP